MGNDLGVMSLSDSNSEITRELFEKRRLFYINVAKIQSFLKRSTSSGDQQWFLSAAFFERKKSDKIVFVGDDDQGTTHEVHFFRHAADIIAELTTCEAMMKRDIVISPRLIGGGSALQQVGQMVTVTIGRNANAK